MENILQFINENFIILIPVIYVIGTFLKKTPKIVDWVIPYVLMTISILLSIGIGGVGVDSIIQAILVTGGAVLCENLYKQTIVKRVDK